MNTPSSSPSSSLPLLCIGFLSGSLFASVAIFTFFTPGIHKWGAGGCFLPFRTWDTSLSRIDVLVEIVAHATHIHLPFLLFLLTKSVSWTLVGIFLAETAEWVNNVITVTSHYTYDDPLDDLLQGLVGLCWGWWFVWCWGFPSPLIQFVSGDAKKVLFFVYSALYCMLCSVATASVWHIPAVLSKLLYTTVSSLGLLLTGFLWGTFLLKDANNSDVQSVWTLLSFVTMIFGWIMQLTNTMRSQSTCLLVFIVASCLCGCLHGCARLPAEPR